MRSMTIKEIEEKVKKIHEAVRAFEKLGISRKVIETYIRGKTGMGLAHIRKVLDAQEEFFDNILMKELTDEDE